MLQAALANGLCESDRSVQKSRQNGQVFIFIPSEMKNFKLSRDVNRFCVAAV